MIGQQEDAVKDAVWEEVKLHFRPEFLNRIDDIIFFHALGRDHLKQIIDIQLAGLMRRLEERKIHVRLSDAAKELLVAEPVHGTGYLPMYIAMANNYFAESDIVVKIVTIETGSGHTNAVLSGQAFAFIGGPEHDAFAKAKGAELRAIVHCVDRGNVYINAIKGQEPKDANWPA